MAKLNDLPAELHRQIADSLDRPDLAALCGTCRLLNAAFTPLLYRDVCFTFVKTEWPRPYLALLLRTLLNSPALGSQIVRLAICGEKHHDNWERLQGGTYRVRPVPPSTSIWSEMQMHCSDFSDEDKALASDRIALIGFSGEVQNEWQSDFVRGDINLLIVLILSYCRKLRNLRLDSDFHRTSHFSRYMDLKERLERFEHLQSVEISSDIDNHGQCDAHFDDFECVSSVVQLPAIDSLAISIPNPCPTITWLGAIPKCTITSLTLVFSQISEEKLGVLLLATPHLKALQFHSTFDCCNDISGRPGRSQEAFFDCAKFRQSLEHVSRTLENLVLEVDFYDSDAGQFPGVFIGTNPPIEPLSKFKSLVRIEIPWGILLGWSPRAPGSVLALKDVLPPSLRTLTLTDGLIHFGPMEHGIEDWTDEILTGMIAAYVPEFGLNPPGDDLPHITVKLDWLRRGWRQPARAKLETICRDAGVRCTIYKRQATPVFKAETASAQPNDTDITSYSLSED